MMHSSWNKVASLMPKIVKNFNAEDIVCGTFTFDSNDVSKFYRLPKNEPTANSYNLLYWKDKELKINFRRLKEEWSDNNFSSESRNGSDLSVVGSRGLPAEPKLIVWTMASLNDEIKERPESSDKKDEPKKKLKGNMKNLRVFFRSLIKVIADTESLMIAQGNDTEFFKYIGNAIDDFSVDTTNKPAGVIGLTIWPFDEINMVDEMKIKFKHVTKKYDGSYEHDIIYQRHHKNRAKLSPHIKYYLFSEVDSDNLDSNDSKDFKDSKNKGTFECVICLNGDTKTFMSILKKLLSRNDDSPVIPVILVKNSAGITDMWIDHLDQKDKSLESFLKKCIHLTETDSAHQASAPKAQQRFEEVEIFDLTDQVNSKEVGQTIIEAIKKGKPWDKKNSTSGTHTLTNGGSESKSQKETSAVVHQTIASKEKGNSKSVSVIEKTPTGTNTSTSKETENKKSKETNSNTSKEQVNSLEYMNFMLICVACGCFNEVQVDKDFLLENFPYETNPWLSLVLISAIEHDQVQTVQFILQNMSVKLKKIFSRQRIQQLYEKSAPEKDNVDSAFHEWVFRILIKLLGPIGYIKRLEVTDSTNSVNKNKDAVQDLFIWSILRNKLELSLLMWEKLDHPLAAALFAHGALKQKSFKSLDRREKEALKKSDTIYADLAIELINKCYNTDEEQTFDLLRQKVLTWGNHSCIQIAIATDNKRFLYQPPCQALCHRLWWWGHQADSQDRRHVIITEVVPEKPSVKLVPSHSNTEWPSVKVSHEKTKQVVRSETWRDESCTDMIKYLLSPVVIFWFNTIGLVIFLLIYALLLTCKMEAGTFHWMEWIIWSWIVMYTLEGFLMFGRVISKTLAQKKYSSKGSTKCRALVSVFMSTDSFKIIDFFSLVCFYLAWFLRYAAYKADTDQQLQMQTAYIVFSVDYILFSLLIFKFFYANKFLGPLLVMIKKMLFTMIKFLIILFVIFTAFAVASEAVLYPGTQFRPSYAYWVFRKAYWSMFGNFFLEEIEAKETAGDCTSDPTKYLDYNYLRCATNIGRYYVPILMGVYVMITNILIFNLLIAKFNSTIQKVESRAEIFWQLQSYELTDEYSRKIFLPPPFFMITILIIISRKWNENIF
ncbi:transient receptor potential cation channel subfamily M member 5, partial [Biomphalaria pfeifferi]